MILSKYKKQKMEVIQKTLPDLYETLKLHLPEFDEESKGKVAGLIIEYVLKSNGSSDIFQDTDLSNFSTEEFLID